MLSVVQLRPIRSAPSRNGSPSARTERAASANSVGSAAAETTRPFSPSWTYSISGPFVSTAAVTTGRPATKASTTARPTAPGSSIAADRFSRTALRSPSAQPTKLTCGRGAAAAATESRAGPSGDHQLEAWEAVGDLVGRRDQVVEPLVRVEAAEEEADRTIAETELRGELALPHRAQGVQQPAEGGGRAGVLGDRDPLRG